MSQHIIGSDYMRNRGFRPKRTGNAAKTHVTFEDRYERGWREAPVRYKREWWLHPTKGWRSTSERLA